jgi:hypothetical protein
MLTTEFRDCFTKGEKLLGVSAPIRREGMKSCITKRQKIAPPITDMLFKLFLTVINAPNKMMFNGPASSLPALETDSAGPKGSAETAHPFGNL